MRVLALPFLSLTIVKRQVSSAKSFTQDSNSFGKSRNGSGTSIKPWRTPAITGLHEDVCPFKIILWNLSERELPRRL